MSDLSKKELVIQILTRPGGTELSNPAIAAEAGCDGKFVRTIRAELENELEKNALRGRVTELEAELATQKATCHCHDQAEKREAPARPTRRRKVHVESYPLFETVG